MFSKISKDLQRAKEITFGFPNIMTLNLLETKFYMVRNGKESIQTAVRVSYGLNKWT